MYWPFIVMILSLRYGGPGASGLLYSLQHVVLGSDHNSNPVYCRETDFINYLYDCFSWSTVSSHHTEMLFSRRVSCCCCFTSLPEDHNSLHGSPQRQGSSMERFCFLPFKSSYQYLITPSQCEIILLCTAWCIRCSQSCRPLILS